MYRAEIKLNSLPDTNWSGSKHQNLFPSFCLLRLIFASKYRIIVRRFRRKLCSTGIYHLICRLNTILTAQIVYPSFLKPSESCYHAVWKFQTLCFLKKFLFNSSPSG